MQYDFDYISKNDERVQKLYRDMENCLLHTQSRLWDCFSFRFEPVGSFARNMVTYDRNSKVGFDLDFDIELMKEADGYTPKEIKDLFRRTFDAFNYFRGYKHAEDSTRVITVKKVNAFFGTVECSCDFAITRTITDRKGKKRKQYIHFNKTKQEYTWQLQSDGQYLLPEKEKWIKRLGGWNELRDCYLEKKNNNDDTDLHSRSLYAQAVHEVCQRHHYYEKGK